MNTSLGGSSLAQNEFIGQSVLLKLANQTSRRFIKTHLPFTLLPPNLTKAGCKIIYVARNPKDVIVSFCHLMQLTYLSDYRGSFEEYWKYFLNDLVIYNPYWSHVKEGWEMRKENNVLFLFYEDLIKDMSGTITKVSQFLGKAITEQQLQRLRDHLSFENFRKNESVNSDKKKAIHIFKAEGQFVRKGKVDGWKEYFSKEMEDETDMWIETNLKSTDIEFPVL